jgi:hypothetical protein
MSHPPTTKGRKTQTARYPGAVEVTLSLQLHMPLYKALIQNPTYPLISGHADPNAKHLIDVYYLKKGILRTKALMERKPIIFSAFHSLRSWENPLISLVFLMTVLSLWWRVSSPIWIPLLLAAFVSMCSLVTAVACVRNWPTPRKQRGQQRGRSSTGTTPANSNNDDKNDKNDKNDKDDKDDKDDARDQDGFPTKAIGQMGGGLCPIVWEDEVGQDPDNTIAKMRMVHGLISSAALPLNKWASRAERFFNAFSGEDPMITILLNICVLTMGVTLTLVFWLFSIMGWNNVAVVVVLVIMTPPLMLTNLLKSTGVSQSSEKESSDATNVSLPNRLSWLYSRVPDLDETIHRRMSQRQIMA